MNEIRKGYQIWMEMHNGKLCIVHPSGYLAFTREEWQEAKTVGDDLFRKQDSVPGQVDE